jgi:hypothetical protein
MTPSEIATALEKNVAGIKSMVWRMERDGWLKSDGDGKYDVNK